MKIVDAERKASMLLAFIAGAVVFGAGMVTGLTVGAIVGTTNIKVPIDDD